MELENSVEVLSYSNTIKFLKFYQPIEMQYYFVPVSFTEETLNEITKDITKLVINEEFHNSGGKEKAIHSGLNSLAIEAFYNYKDVEKPLRNKQVVRKYLPNTKEHVKVNIKGPSGAGKTTLLGKLLNLDKSQLATAVNKTTVGTREYLMEDSPTYSLCCTFLSQFEVQRQLQDITQRVIEILVDNIDIPLKKVRSKFVDSTDQQFRIEQILGKVSEHNTNNISQLFMKFIEDIKQLIQAEKQAHNDVSDEEFSDENLEEIVLNILSCKVSEEFQLQLFSNIQYKLVDLITKYPVAYEKNQFGWIDYIYEHNMEKALFDELVYIFSSIKHSTSENLLTPLVDILRVKGPLYPDWVEDKENYHLHLVDGIGIDHDQKDAITLPNHVTEEFLESDYIIWLENAANVTSNTVKLFFEEMERTKQLDKVILYYTHLDELKGDKFDDLDDKISAIDNNFENVFSVDDTSKKLLKKLEKVLPYKTFYFENLKEETLSEENQLNLKQTATLLKKPIDTKLSSEISIVLDENHLISNYLKIYDTFWFNWNNIVNSKHWSKFKAMTERLAYTTNIYGYDHLLPVEFRKNLLLDVFNNALENASVVSNNVEDLENISKVLTQAVASSLSDTMIQLIAKSKKIEWATSYQYKGTGSHSRRKEYVKWILQQTFQEVNISNVEQSNLYREFKQIIENEISKIVATHPKVSISILPREIPSLA